MTSSWFPEAWAPLASITPDHAQVDVVHPHRLADGVAVREEVLAGRGAQDGHQGAGGDLLGGDELALGDREVAHAEVVRGDAVEAGGGVLAVGHHLPEVAATSGATATAWGTRPESTMASASSEVRVGALPAWARTPPEVVAPGETKRRLVPRP